MYIGCMAQQTTQRENRETLGGRLARLRKEQGLTQIELGAKTDLSQVLISDYERGRLQPSPDTLIKMANALEWRPMSFSASKVNQPAGASQA